MVIMNRYKKLAFNTVIFATGTFSSKLLVFLMLPLYTRALTNAEYGEIDLVVQTCNILIPVVSAGILNAVVRFGLDRAAPKKSVFSVGLFTIIFGLLAFGLARPFIQNIYFISDYVGYVYLFILTSSFHSLCSNFIRSQEHVKLYAFDGIFRTVLTVVLNIVFLIVLHYGVEGYLLATILSDATSAVMLFFAARLYRFISLSGIDKSLIKDMFKYSLPLIPTTISVWIINISDRYILSYLIGNEATGLYAIAYKVPTIITIMAAIFMDAWQISSVSEYKKEDGARFFTQVFSVYSSLVFLTSSAIVAFTKIITGVLVSADFYAAWRFMPVLVMSTIFACFATFLSSIYMNEKKSGHVLLTTAISAVMNIILNIILIPVYDIQGAAIATLFSYIVMFSVRAVHSKSFIRMSYNFPKLAVNAVVVLLQTIIILMEIQNWFIYEMALLFIVIAINIKTVLTGVRKVVL
jgi:O-antigen/teichoic acid export membrane protein